MKARARTVPEAALDDAVALEPLMARLDDALEAVAECGDRHKRLQARAAAGLLVWMLRRPRSSGPRIARAHAAPGAAPSQQALPAAPAHRAGLNPLLQAECGLASGTA